MNACLTESFAEICQRRERGWKGRPFAGAAKSGGPREQRSSPFRQILDR